MSDGDLSLSENDSSLSDSGFEYRPANLSGSVALAGSLVVAVVLVSVSVVVSFGAFASTIVTAVALVRGSHHGVTLAGSLCFGSVLLAGVLGGPVIPVVIATIATLLVYDAGHYAIALGSQVGSAGTTTSAELFHLGTSLTILTLFGTVGVALFVGGPGGQPVTVLLALLVAALLFISVLSLRRTPW